MEFLTHLLLLQKELIMFSHTINTNINEYQLINVYQTMVQWGGSMGRINCHQPLIVQIQAAA